MANLGRIGGLGFRVDLVFLYFQRVLDVIKQCTDLIYEMEASGHLFAKNFFFFFFNILMTFGGVLEAPGKLSLYVKAFSGIFQAPGKVHFGRRLPSAGKGPMNAGKGIAGTFNRRD